MTKSEDRLVMLQYKTCTSSLGSRSFSNHLSRKHLSVTVQVSAFTDLVTPEGMHSFENIRVRATDKQGRFKGTVNLEELSREAMAAVMALLNRLRANAVLRHQSEYNKQVQSLFELAESIMEGPVQIVANRSKSYDAVLAVIEQVAGEDILQHYFQTGEVALGLASKN